MRPPRGAAGIWRPAQCSDEELGRWVQTSLMRAYGQAEASPDSWSKVKNRIRQGPSAEHARRAGVWAFPWSSLIQGVLVAMLVLVVRCRWMVPFAWSSPPSMVEPAVAVNSEPSWQSTDHDLMRSVDLLRYQWHMSPTERLAARDVAVSDWKRDGVRADRHSAPRWRDIGETLAET